jgi:hypothetical protein
MAEDLRIVGLACPADGAPLWALGGGTAARPAELVRIDSATGIETVIGPTGTAPSELQSLELDRGSVDPAVAAAALHDRP